MRVLLFTGLSPSAHAASSPADPTPGWWESMIGAGPADRHAPLLRGLRQLARQPVRLVEPRVDRSAHAAGRMRSVSRARCRGHCRAAVARSCARSASTRVAAVIGPSLGGMTVLAFAVQFPDAVERLITISGAAAATPFAIALRSLQREIVRSDPAWRERPVRTGTRARGRAAARTQARHDHVPFGRGMAAAFRPQARRRDRMASPASSAPASRSKSYLENQAHRFAETFDANCYLYLSRAMDQFDLRDHGAARSTRRSPRFRAPALAGHRCRDGHAVPDRPAAGDRRAAANGGGGEVSSTRSRRSRVTTRSWSTRSVSSRRSPSFCATEHAQSPQHAARGRSARG